MGKIAVTGSTGFIGSRLVDRLLSSGHSVYAIGRDMRPVNCDVVYHLACPSTTEAINKDPTSVMDTIFDVTRQAMKICPTALFVNASSFGAEFVDNTPQGAYNVAKRAMEIYLTHSGLKYKNYRLPSVYGETAPKDSFVVRCVNGNAYYPTTPEKQHYISHVDDVVEALVNLTDVPVEKITLGEIYEQFATGRRGLHRPASCS